MTRLRKESHARMLGIGMCIGPSSSSAAWKNHPAKPAPTSASDPSSSSSCSANETAPSNTVKPIERNFFEDVVLRAAGAQA